jgi:CubicO group peptidase (beta-lactamase class C family)
MGKWTRLWLAVAVAVMVLGGCSAMPKKPDNPAPGDYGYTKEYISWLIRKEMKKHDVTGLSIALVDDQRVVWAAGFGYADRDGKVPAAPETVYRAGSISKLFTDSAVMQLAEQGKLDIDQPLQRYLPEFSIGSRFAATQPITPRTIMTHHSGLPSDLLKGMWTARPEPFESEVELLRDEYISSPPNFVFSYSNVGLTILGHALEKVAGRNFSSHLAESLLLPLGMTHSAFAQGADRSPLAAKAYRDGEEAEEPPLRDVPAGGLNSSVLDLSRFMEMVFAGGRVGERQLLKPETIAEMLRPQNGAIPLDLNFRVGLGWMLGGMGEIDVKNAGPVAHHGGATLYHRSQLIVLPAQKLGVVVLANSASAGGVVNKVAVAAVKLALEAKTGFRQPGWGKPAQDAGTLSPEELRAYAGRYATVAGVVNIVAESDHLRTEVMDNSVRLVPRPGGRLGLKYKLLGLFPISLGELDHVEIARATIAGREILKAAMDGQEMLIGELIRPRPIPGKWLGRLGEYEITNAGDDAVLVEGLRLRNDAGLLLVEYAMPLFFKGTMSVALAPLSETEAVIWGLGRGKGETVRVVKVGGEELLSYGGYLFRKKGV